MILESTKTVYLFVNIDKSYVSISAWVLIVNFGSERVHFADDMAETGWEGEMGHRFPQVDLKTLLI